MKLRREVGFWRALMGLRLGELVLAPEFVAACVLGVGGGIWLLTTTTVDARLNIVGDYLVLLGTLVGVVLAGLALVITLLSDSYLRALGGEDKVIRFLQPFMLAIGAQIATVIGSVAYRASATELSLRPEQIFFGVLSFLFVYASLEVVAVTRNLIAHGVTRAKQAEVDELEGAQGVRQLPRGGAGRS